MPNNAANYYKMSKGLYFNKNTDPTQYAVHVLSQTGDRFRQFRAGPRALSRAAPRTSSRRRTRLTTLDFLDLDGTFKNKELRKLMRNVLEKEKRVLLNMGNTGQDTGHDRESINAYLQEKRMELL